LSFSETPSDILAFYAWYLSQPFLKGKVSCACGTGGKKHCPFISISWHAASFPAAELWAKLMNSIAFLPFIVFLHRLGRHAPIALSTDECDLPLPHIPGNPFRACGRSHPGHPV
jgi:hypothetical protein